MAEFERHLTTKESLAIRPIQELQVMKEREDSRMALMYLLE